MPFFKKLRRFSKHKKLCEEWALANSRECVEGGVGGGGGQEDAEDPAEATFALKYLGSTLVETPSSEEATAEAIKTIITMAKASGKKLQRVSLAVSLRGIRMTDVATEEDQLQVSIYRISYCSADATHDHVFAFIATNLNETMECHAFLCPKRKMAQTVTLTVAQAFNTAYQAWQLTQVDPRIHHTTDKSPPMTDENCIEYHDKIVNEMKNNEMHNRQNNQNVKRNNINETQKNLLIDLSSDSKPKEKSWVCFEEETALDNKNTRNNNSPTSIPMSTLRATSTSTSTSTSTRLVTPRPSPSPLAGQNAWGESRSVDLMCS
ncbi:uncharacterized protein LOC124415914 isoform X2 [Diprion similis]|uniref:uncharacterized protein LOC124415914 isoform X2 n=1 Tax=Diprion similis TaxID=362088 RepID=UPI001EF8C39F|nr:uncharacterized protein LOC124415914 isoform X2 [Diprion similis]